MVVPSTKSTGKPWSKVAQYNAAKEVLPAAGIDDVEGAVGGVQAHKLPRYVQAGLEAAARRSRHERRTAKALYVEIRAAAGSRRVTDFIRAWVPVREPGVLAGSGRES